MYRILRRSAGNVVEIEAGDALTQDDLRTLRAALRALVTERGRVRILLRLEGSSGWDDAAANPADVLDLALERDVERLAVVVAKTSGAAARALFGAVRVGVMRVFHPSQLEEAREWLVAADAPVD